jgi:hypothetical protein
MAQRGYGPAEAAALEKLTQLKQLSVFGVTLDPMSIAQITQAMPKARVQIMK